MQRFALRCSIHFAEANAARMQCSDVQCCADKTLQKERERESERATERKRKEAVFARSWTRESADFWSDTTVGGNVGQGR